MSIDDANAASAVGGDGEGGGVNFDDIVKSLDDALNQPAVSTMKIWRVCCPFTPPKKNFAEKAYELVLYHILYALSLHTPIIID